MSQESERNRQALESHWGREGAACLENQEFLQGVDRLLLLGEQAYALLAEYGGDLFDSWQSNSATFRNDGAEWINDLVRSLPARTPTDDLITELGAFARRKRLETLWLDVVERAQLELVSRRQSRLAEALIATLVEHLKLKMAAEFGKPVNDRGEVQNIIILAAGKLGAEEQTAMGAAEFVIAFTGHGQSDAEHGISNESFFNTLVSRLGELTEDERLSGLITLALNGRPLGESGPLCLSRDATEHHYETEGRAKDRHALISMRSVSGDVSAGESLLANLRPFVYRRYLDFNMLDALRRLKRTFSQAGGSAAHLHAGPGGLGEIEFVVRAVQLVRGGQQPHFQKTSVLEALDALAAGDGLPATTCKSLSQAYRFMQRTVNRLQWMTGTETCELPEDNTLRDTLAATMDQSGWDAFFSQLEQHRQFVHAEFNLTFATENQPESPYTQWQEIWEMPISPQHSQAQLSLRGFVEADKAIDLLVQLREGTLRRGMSERSAQRLDQFMPSVLAACSRTRDPDQALQRMIDLLRAIRGRSTYIALLAERPGVLKKLVEILAAPWIARELTRYPVLLDEVLDARPVLDVSSTAALQAALGAELPNAGDRDLEAEMDALRRFRRSATLQIARLCLAREHSVEQTQRSLGLVAESIVGRALAIAWRDVRTADDPELPPLAVIGLGPLGSGELTFDAHLDLTFVRLDEADMGICTRCAQRLVHILSAMTSAGRLYQVDSGLQPLGNTGVVVSAISEFQGYHRSEARLLDTQALLRARFVSGNPGLAAQFEQTRSDVLLGSRDVEDLKKGIPSNRDYLVSRLAQPSAGQFNVVSSPGGLLDVICLTHFLILQHSDPGLIAKRNTGALLALLRARSLGESSDIDELLHAFHAYAGLSQQTTLLERSGEVSLSRAEPHASHVKAIWTKVFRGV